MASRVQGFKKAAKKFKVSAVCAVGLCDTGALLPEVQKANALPEDFPLFTMQGGMDKAKLYGLNKLMINMLTKGLASQKERTETDERMLYLLTQNENFVSKKNTSAFMEWYNLHKNLLRRNDMVKFICYPKCITCQKAKKWLDDNKIEYELRDIKLDNPTLDELADWYKLSGLPLKKFFNTSGLLYKSLDLKNKLPEMTEEEMLNLLATDGMLVKRPLLIGDDFVLVGFKETEWRTNFNM